MNGLFYLKFRFEPLNSVVQKDKNNDLSGRELALQHRPEREPMDVAIYEL
jgi:hypothetical protein